MTLDAIRPWDEKLATRLDVPVHELWYRLRHAAGLGFREAAGIIGVSHTALWKWETGRSEPTRLHRRRLLALLRQARHDVERAQSPSDGSKPGGSPTPSQTEDTPGGD